MPAPDQTAPHASASREAGWRGSGVLTGAWLLVLALVGSAGWMAAADTPAERRPLDAEIYRGELPDPQVTVAAGPPTEADPRIRQLVVRDLLRPLPASRGGTGNPDAPPKANTPPKADTGPAPPSAGAAGDPVDAVSGSPAASPDAKVLPSVQLAARSDSGGVGASDAGPLPPAVPQARGGQTGRRGGDEGAGRYSVQIGAFRVRANALARAARLSEAGYDARILHAFATRSRLYMVRVGAFDARPAAIAHARELSRDVGMETWPVRN